jgi:hypothetical protein
VLQTHHVPDCPGLAWSVVGFRARFCVGEGTDTRITLFGLVPEALQISPEKWWKEEASPEINSTVELPSTPRASHRSVLPTLTLKFIIGNPAAQLRC